MENILETTYHSHDSSGLIESSKKKTIILLRWLIVIITSYMLLTSSSTWLGPTLVNTTILFYILTNILIYFVDDRYFDSSYFYSPLVVFDTLYVTASLVLSGQIGTDFYLAYFLIIILCTIWNDFRGLLVISALVTLLYGYFLLQTGNLRDESMYLRIPFLFFSPFSVRSTPLATSVRVSDFRHRAHHRAGTSRNRVCAAHMEIGRAHG